MRNGLSGITLSNLKQNNPAFLQKSLIVCPVKFQMPLKEVFLFRQSERNEKGDSKVPLDYDADRLAGRNETAV